MTDIVDWLRLCASNEPNNSDAESLWAAGDLITFLRSSLKEIREENDRLKGELRTSSSKFNTCVGLKEQARRRAEHAEASCEAMAKALELAKDHSELPDEILDIVDDALADYRKGRG